MSSPSPRDRSFAATWTRRSREQALFAIGALLICIHVGDEIVSLGEFEPATVLAAAMVALVPFYPALSPRWRAALALGLGLMRVVGSVGHVLDVLRGTPGPSDYTGFFQLFGGILLVALGIAVVGRHWPEWRRA